MPEQQKERELKAAFIQHLPERINSIGNDWGRLSRGPWDDQLRNKLCRKLQTLTGSCGNFGLINLSESSFSLEVYLSAFGDTDNRPTSEQQSTVNTLIAAIRHESELIRSKSGSERPVNLLVYRLSGNDQAAPGLSGMLEQQGCTLLSFNQPDDVEGEIQRRLPDVLIIDDRFLPRMAQLNRELAIQQERQHKQVGLICLSQSRDLEQRLLALRSGMDAYYTIPVNTRELCDRVIELAMPKADRYRILIVEDDPSQADFAASVLSKSGMKTQVLTDPLKVIDALDEFRPDLILMDLYMPNANGIELTTIIREHPDGVSTPIVFLSGELNTDKQLHALSVGADDFLSKPIRPRHLINTITNRVQRARILEKRRHPPSSRDRLTGLYSRRYFYAQLDRITAEAQDRGTTGGVLHISLKQAGSTRPDHESFLAEMASLLSGQLEDQDIAACMDAESFAVLVMRPHQKNVIALAEKLAHKLLGLKEQTMPAPYIGIAIFGEQQTSAADLMANAVAACQEIQDSQQHVKLYQENDRTAAEAEAGKLPHLFRQALDKNSFQLYFRTLEHPRKSGPEAYELKPRLQLADGRQLGGSELLSLADEEGLGTPFSQWLIERALNILEEKRATGKNGLFFVGQSSESIFQGTIGGWLRDQLRARQMVGVGLVCEYRIAELSVDLKHAREHFSQLQEMGVKISLARFGANGTAIKVLQYLKADYVRPAGPVLRADQREIAGIVEQIHGANAGVALPASVDAKSISPGWLELADLAPPTSGITNT
jgi:PleD family two-component response regulator/EAL domain-containing protein (putative c-di-GMP-specific phosphodiesterase class I)